MKPKLPIWLCVLISLALVAFGLLFGTARGFLDERKQVEALLQGENGLQSVLAYRGSDGQNLAVVAQRHLTGDADVGSLRSAALTLKNAAATLTEKKEADETLQAAVQAVTEKLNQTATYQTSQRDAAYVEMLSSDLAHLAQSEMIQTYNEAAVVFNQKLAQPFPGAIAGLLGVKRCEVYE